MPISANQTISLDGRLTFAVNLWMRSTFSDVFLGHNPLLTMLKSRGNVDVGQLGPQLIEPIMIPQAGGPTTRGITDPYVDLTHLPPARFTSAYFIPAEYAIPVSVSKRDLKLLTGAKVKRINYVENVLKGALKDFFSTLNTDIWDLAGSTGAAGAANKLASLLCFLNRGGTSTTATQAPTAATLTEQIYNGGTAPGGSAVGTSPVTLVGGIERNAADAGPWCTPVKNPSSAETLTVTVWNNLISLATRGTDTPDYAAIHRVGFDKLVTLLQGAGYANIFETSKEMRKFSGFRYRGVETIFDDSVPAVASGVTSFEALMMNTNYLKLACDTLEPEMERKSDPKRLLMCWLGSWYGQLVSGHLGRVHARHAKLVA